MNHTVQEIMTPAPIALSAGATVIEAARCMRDEDIGDVLVTKDGRLCGLVTDRDLVVRAMADERDIRELRLADICPENIITVSADEPIERAVEIMKEKAIRRLPVMQNEDVVGIVSIGDLAIERDPSSALAAISTKAPNN